MLFLRMPTINGSVTRNQHSENVSLYNTVIKNAFLLYFRTEQVMQTRIPGSVMISNLNWCQRDECTHSTHTPLQRCHWLHISMDPCEILMAQKRPDLVPLNDPRLLQYSAQDRVEDFGERLLSGIFACLTFEDCENYNRYFITMASSSPRKTPKKSFIFQVFNTKTIPYT